MEKSRSSQSYRSWFSKQSVSSYLKDASDQFLIAIKIQTGKEATEH